MNRKKKQLAQFGEAVLERVQDHLANLKSDIDYIAAIAVDSGLMQKVHYDPDIHDISFSDGHGCAEDGDVIYYWGDDQ